MIAGSPEDEPMRPLTEEWRKEALFRLYRGIKSASRDNGTSLKGCIVPGEAVDPATGDILQDKNTYQKVRVNGRNYPAHVAVLMLVHDRHPIRNRGKEINEVGMHLCNNPACRNSLHLKFGTSREDSAHKVLCGRAPSGANNGHSTKPEKTPRGENHYNNRLKGLERTTAIQLLKKYGNKRGAVRAIAAYLNTTFHTINGLKREGQHLLPDIADTDIELDIVAWARVNSVPKRSKADVEIVVTEIRRRFHMAPVLERSGLLSALAGEYGYDPTYIRKILNREVHPNIANDIPIPTEWGIGRRKSFKQKSAIGGEQ